MLDFDASTHRLANHNVEKIMDLKHFRLLYAYNHWANARLVDRAEQLTPEQLHAPNPGGFGSVHDTFVHLMETEFFWAGLIWPGKAIDIDWEPFEFDPSDYPDLAAIRARWTEIEADLSAFIDELEREGANSLEQIIVWNSDGVTMRRRPLWPQLLDVALHAEQHRSEIAMALTNLGFSPGEISLTLYMRENEPELFG